MGEPEPWAIEGYPVKQFRYAARNLSVVLLVGEIFFGADSTPTERLAE